MVPVFFKTISEREFLFAFVFCTLLLIGWKRVESACDEYQIKFFDRMKRNARVSSSEALNVPLQSNSAAYCSGKEIERQYSRERRRSDI